MTVLVLYLPSKTYLLLIPLKFTSNSFFMIGQIGNPQSVVQFAFFNKTTGQNYLILDSLAVILKKEMTKFSIFNFHKNTHHVFG